MRCISLLYVKGNHVPCGRCNNCLQTRAMDWAFRLGNELKYARSAHFVTLTMRFVPQSGVSKRHLQLFFKRLRKSLPQGVRYFACGEYGEKTKRPHYHAIIFNATSDSIMEAWKLGHVHIGDVTENSIGYVTGYTLKTSDYPPSMRKPFALMSRRPPLGYRYLETHKAWHRGNQSRVAKMIDLNFDWFRSYTMVNGVRGHLPRFYRDKIFSKLERAVMLPLQVYKQDQEHNSLLEKLAKFHDSPEGYLMERKYFAHQLLKTKKLQHEFI